eukprot:106768-Hanusia_phi.AAC.1
MAHVNPSLATWRRRSGPAASTKYLSVSVCPFWLADMAHVHPSLAAWRRRSGPAASTKYLSVS